MSINNIKNFYPSNNQINNVQEKKEVAQKVKQENQEKKVETNGKETVMISQEAMEKIKTENHDNIRQDKVDELKKKIANGEFKVNTNKVADKLLHQYQKNSLL